MVSVNYAGRDIDLGIFANVTIATVGSDQLMELAFGTVTTGIEKLAQNIVIAFLSESGSDPYDDDFGTDFMTSAKSGQIRSDGDVTSEFSVAAAQIEDYFVARVTEDTPDDETLDTITLSSFTFEDAQLIMYISILSAAGESREVILPVSIAIV